MSLEAADWKLWLYTNYDCNFHCTYCVARSHPNADRRALGLTASRQLIDEAAALGFGGVYLTGGEPFLLRDIFDVVGHATRRLPTTVLTNGSLLTPARLDRLAEVADDRLTVQVSLDGARPEHHDPLRGEGTWRKAVTAIECLLDRGFCVAIATTKAAENGDHLDELCRFHLALGIPEERHVVRLQARRGFAAEGVEVAVDSLTPELTANRDGLFWHPISTDDDMLVMDRLFPLAEGVERVRARLAELDAQRQEEARQVR